jgi:hypothetical protein
LFKFHERLEKSFNIQYCIVARFGNNACHRKQKSEGRERYKNPSHSLVPTAEMRDRRRLPGAGGVEIECT